MLLKDDQVLPSQQQGHTVPCGAPATLGLLTAYCFGRVPDPPRCQHCLVLGSAGAMRDGGGAPGAGLVMAAFERRRGLGTRPHSKEGPVSSPILLKVEV